MKTCEYLQELIETQLCDLSEELSRINGMLAGGEYKTMSAKAAFGVIHGRLCDIDTELQRIWRAAAIVQRGEQDLSQQT